MSFKLFKKDNFFNGTHQEFLIDSKNDLTALETSFDCELGDKAFTPNGTMYTRHSDDFEGDLWEEIKETSGGGSGGGGDGGVSGNAAWNDVAKNLVIIELEPTSDNAADMSCFCSDGVVFSSLALETDAETGDITPIVGEWANDTENPVPAADFETICACIEIAVLCHFYALREWFFGKNVPTYYLEHRIVVCR